MTPEEAIENDLFINFLFGSIPARIVEYKGVPIISVQAQIDKEEKERLKLSTDIDPKDLEGYFTTKEDINRMRRYEENILDQLQGDTDLYDQLLDKVMDEMKIREVNALANIENYTHEMKYLFDPTRMIKDIILAHEEIFKDFIDQFPEYFI